VTSALRTCPDRQKADAWTVALASQGIATWLFRTDEGWTLTVEDSDLPRATAVVDAYESENAPSAREIAEYGPSYAAWVASALLVAVFVASASREDWVESGLADAQRILGGEVWRVITAQTLHADAGHLLSNAVFLTLFGTFVCRALGPGVGLLAILLAGALGNATNALVQGEGHRSLGASTAVFGALGILAGLRRPGPSSAWRRSLPLQAAAAFLVVLGASPRSDVLAHVFGLAAGAGVGLAARGLAAPARPPAQALALAACAGGVALSWLAALR
jgi:membrane associated rhomboid family serine protease